LTSGPAAIADAIKDMGALLILNMSKNSMKGAEAGKALGDALAANTILKELDLSGQPSTPWRVAMPNMDITFVEAFAPGLTDNGAISSVNLLLNDIRIDQAKDLVIILKDHPTLKTLCGIKGDETELDMSGKMCGAGDAIMLVPDIINNRAMTSLNLASNRIGSDGARHVADAIKVSISAAVGTSSMPF
jgi:hypothetical protein